MYAQPSLIPGRENAFNSGTGKGRSGFTGRTTMKTSAFLKRFFRSVSIPKKKSIFDVDLHP